MTVRLAILWLSAHGLIPGALFGIAWLLQEGFPAVGDTPSGGALFLLPVALGIFQAALLSPDVRPWAWALLTVVGFFGAMLFAWFFIPAIGFTTSLAQSFAFTRRIPITFRLYWMFLGTVGWLVGIAFGGRIAPANESGIGLVLYPTVGLIEGAFLLSAAFLMRRRIDDHSPSSTTPSRP